MRYKLLGNSLIQRTPERELMPMAKELGITVLAWSPLGGGWLTGKYSQDGNGDGSEQKRLNHEQMSRMVQQNERNLQIQPVN